MDLFEKIVHVITITGLAVAIWLMVVSFSIFACNAKADDSSTNSASGNAYARDGD